MLARAISSWGRLLGLGRADGAEDRREHGRVACDLETTCHAAGREHGVPVPARVRNVSRSGVLLLVPLAYRAGELLSVKLPGAAGEPAAEVLACVVRCDLSGERFEVGCSFAASLADDDLRRFGVGVEAEPADQRGWIRFVTQAQVAYQVVRTPELEEWSRADVVNISGGGVALRIEEALEVGELLSVEVRREGTPSVTALASVVRTCDAGEKRVVGCNFIHELPEEQVAKLLG